MSTRTKSSLLAVVAAALALSEASSESLNTVPECGWIGVRVSPVSAVMAESLGMDMPYGAISDSPEPDSPAAGQIEVGDLITAINDTPLMNAQDFVPAIAAMHPAQSFTSASGATGSRVRSTLSLVRANARRDNKVESFDRGKVQARAAVQAISVMTTVTFGLSSS